MGQIAETLPKLGLLKHQFSWLVCFPRYTAAIAAGILSLEAVLRVLVFKADCARSATHSGGGGKGEGDKSSTTKEEFVTVDIACTLDQFQASASHHPNVANFKHTIEADAFLGTIRTS